MIQNVKMFDSTMQNLGYTISAKFLYIKYFDSIEIDVTRKDNQIQSIIGYKNSEIINVPNDILNQVKNDINEAVQSV
jgi:hypothetical protein